jgi:3-hydroxyisobutyrate dehydrogenase-like beta-hydroxyacid dehydrogenase
MKKKYELNLRLELDEELDKDTGCNQARVLQILNDLLIQQKQKQAKIMAVKNSRSSKQHLLYHIEKDLAIIEQMVKSFKFDKIET